jgi:hypothetical protein
MKKLFICLFLSVIFLFPACDSGRYRNYVKSQYTEVKDGCVRLSENLYYPIQSQEELQTFLAQYSCKTSDEKEYGEEFFKNQLLYVFLISESSGGNRHELKQRISDTTLSLEAFSTAVGNTDDMAYWIVYLELDKSMFGSQEKEVWLHSKKLTSVEKFETKLSAEMPKDFDFFFESGYFSYDSRTDILQDGNLLTGKRSQVTLELSEETKKSIYLILRGCGFDQYPESISLQNNSSFFYISMLFSKANYQIYLHGYDSNCDQYPYFEQLGQALNTIINDYIKETDEYLSLQKQIA